MSGVEVLGALAAASQLAEQGLKTALFIADLCSKIRAAPESIHKQSTQLEQLISIAKLIEANPALQTDAVESILRSCVRNVEHLQKILTSISAAAETAKPRKYGSH